MSQEQKTRSPRSKSGKPTLRTVADATGFAVTTVSRALAQDPAISARTRDLVASAAAELGYVPDRAARRLRTGKTNVISVLLDPHAEIMGFGDTMLEGMLARIVDTQYHINVTHHALGTDPLTPIRNIVRNRLADGVIFARTEHNDARVHYLLENDFPFVTHGRTEITTPHPSMDYDNAAFAEAAVARLVEKGRQRLCLIPPSAQFTFYTHMTGGFARGVAAAGVAHELTIGVDLNSEAHALHAYFCDRFKHVQPPDGIICAGETAAMAVAAAAADSGLEIGKDLDLVAKRTSDLFDLFRPRVDTIFEDIREAGFQIADLLLARINGAPIPGLQRVHAPALDF